MDFWHLQAEAFRQWQERGSLAFEEAFSRWADSKGLAPWDRLAIYALARHPVRAARYTEPREAA